MVFQIYIFLTKLNNVAKKQYDQKTLKYVAKKQYDQKTLK